MSNPHKFTALEQLESHKVQARAVPVEDKKKFWTAMTVEGKTLGEARLEVGLDLLVAAQLVLQLHLSIHVPMSVEDIK